jgi:hypothetical protein
MLPKLLKFVFDVPILGVRGEFILLLLVKLFLFSVLLYCAVKLLLLFEFADVTLFRYFYLVEEDFIF